MSRTEFLRIDSIDKEEGSKSNANYIYELNEDREVYTSTFVGGNFPRMGQNIREGGNQIRFVTRFDATHCRLYILNVNPGLYSVNQLIDTLNTYLQSIDKSISTVNLQLRFSYDTIRQKMILNNEIGTATNGRFNIHYLDNKEENNKNEMLELLGFDQSQLYSTDKIPTGNFECENNQVVQPAIMPYYNGVPLIASNSYHGGLHIRSMYVCCKQLCNYTQVTIPPNIPNPYVLYTQDVSLSAEEIILEVNDTNRLTMDLTNEAGYPRKLNRLHVQIFARTINGEWYQLNFNGLPHTLNFIIGTANNYKQN